MTPAWAAPRPSVDAPGRLWHHDRMTLRTSVIGALSVCLLAGALPAAAAVPAPVEPAADSAHLQHWADQIVAAGAPGATLVLAEDGEVSAASSGVSDVRFGRELAPDDRFRAGSVTKTFIATLTLQLVDAGQLDLDATVAEYLPGLLPDGDVITLRQLLNHTSGLFNYTEDPAFLEAAFGQGERFRPRHLVAYSTSHPLLFPPGEGYYYSNTNYVVLGMLVRQAAHKPLRGLIEDRIAEPLGLENTVLPTYQRAIPGPHARGYLGLPEGRLLDVTKAFSPSWAWAAGALVSTAPDLTEFYRALLAGELLDPELLAEMKTTVSTGEGSAYGLGLLSLELPCGTAWGHDGLYLGYYDMILSTEDGSRQAAFMINVDPLNGVPPAEVLTAATEGLLRTFCNSGDWAGTLESPELASPELRSPQLVSPGVVPAVAPR